MPRFYQYIELIRRQPVQPSYISWLAGQISQLPFFHEGVAVTCGSVAWGKPSWRSDIDVVTFKTQLYPDIAPSIDDVIARHDERTEGQFLLPRVDVIAVGTESQQLVTRDNLVRGSAPITQSQTIREIFQATNLRFSDHIGSLAQKKGDPWRAFVMRYLSEVPAGAQVRREEIQKYVTGFADTWRQEPLGALDLAADGDFDEAQLSMMSFAENFPFHLMRQILAERGCYPSPDRAPDIRTSFAELSPLWAGNLLMWLDSFLEIGSDYDKIVESCMRDSSRISGKEYHDRLTYLFGTLPFAGVEEAVWDYLADTAAQ